MNSSLLIAAMERFETSLPLVVAGVSSEDARWKPADGAWSVLEIVRHLCDEEVEDFRTRLRLTLADPTQDWPPIDPEGWARERRYNEGHLDDAIERFRTERRESITWLRSLGDVDWSTARQHPRFGPIPAGDLLGAWAAHDALHLRQIAKRLHQLAGRDTEPFSTRYAGEWGA